MLRHFSPKSFSDSSYITNLQLQFSKNQTFKVKTLHADVMLADEPTPPPPLQEKPAHVHLLWMSLHEKWKELNLRVLEGKRTHCRAIIQGGAFTSAPSLMLWCNLAHVRASCALWWGRGWGWRCQNAAVVHDLKWTRCLSNIKIFDFFSKHILKFLYKNVKIN